MACTRVGRPESGAIWTSVSSQSRRRRVGLCMSPSSHRAAGRSRRSPKTAKQRCSSTGSFTTCLTAHRKRMKPMHAKPRRQRSSGSIDRTMPIGERVLSPPCAVRSSRWSSTGGTTSSSRFATRWARTLSSPSPTARLPPSRRRWMRSPAALPGARHPNRVYLAAVLCNRDIGAEATYFENVKRVPAGHVLTLATGGAHTRRYWDPGPVAGTEDWTDGRAHEVFDRLLCQAVGRARARPRGGLHERRHRLDHDRRRRAGRSGRRGLPAPWALSLPSPIQRVTRSLCSGRSPRL